MGENCPNCNMRIENLQDICEICGAELKWEPEYRKDKNSHPFYPLARYVLKGKGLKKR